MTDEEAAESLPKIMWIPAGDVATRGGRGLDAGSHRGDPGNGQPGRGRAGPSGAEVAPRPAAGRAPPGAEAGPEGVTAPSRRCLRRRRPNRRRRCTARIERERGRRQRQRRCPATRLTPRTAVRRTPCGLPWSPPSSRPLREVGRAPVTFVLLRRDTYAGHGHRGLMPQLVSDLNLPYLDTVGLERREAVDAIAAARSVHWLARAELGYSVTNLADVTAILRDQRFHSALSMIARGARVPGLERPRPPQRVDPHHGGRRPCPPAPVGGACLHAGVGQPPPAHHATGGRRTRRPRGRTRRVRAGGGRLRALPDPDHLRAAGRAAGGLEAVLGAGRPTSSASSTTTSPRICP